MGNDAYVWEPMLQGAMNSGATRNGARPARSTQPILKQTGRPAAPGRIYRKSDLRQQQAPQQRFTAEAGNRFIRQGRPFTAIKRRPSVSPYLNLFRDEINDTSANYHAYVRPQLEQQRVNDRQRHEVQRSRGQLAGDARGQVRQASATAPINRAAPAMRGRPAPSTSNVARFGDTGQFFGGRR